MHYLDGCVLFLIELPILPYPYLSYYAPTPIHTPHLLPTGSEERGVLGVGSIPVAILPSCQDMKTTDL